VGHRPSRTERLGDDDAGPRRSRGSWRSSPGSRRSRRTARSLRPRVRVSWPASASTSRPGCSSRRRPEMGRVPAAVRAYVRASGGALAWGGAPAVGRTDGAGEELFWRGLFLPELERAFEGGVVGPLAAWGVFVAANVPSLNLAIVAGRGRGGDVGRARGLVRRRPRGLLCHAGWTTLMLAFPPVSPVREVPS